MQKKEEKGILIYMKQKFDVKGMSCAACQQAVERAAKKVKGVEKAEVSLLSNSMVVEGDFDVQEIISEIEKVGYGASLQGEKKETPENVEKKADKEGFSIKTRLIVSIVFMLLVMTLAMLKMFADKIAFSDFWLDLFFGEKGAFNLAFTEMLLSTPVLLVNSKYFINGFKALFHRSPNMDSLIAVGSASAFLYGIKIIYEIAASYVSGNLSHANMLGMQLYFESSTMILTLITLGKTLEERQKRKATDEIKKLVELTPKKAVILKNGVETECAAEEVEIGDIIVLKSGDMPCVDGIIESGSALFDESNLSGESIPVTKGEGEHIFSGTVMVSGYVTYRAVKRASDSSIQRIASLIEEASNSKAPVQKFADKVAGVFVPVVMTIALITLAVWLIIGKEFSYALNMAISVLVISCPCALGLATPVAIMVGTGTMAKKGILVKSGELVQNLADVKVAVFDKTGTITRGKPEVTDVITFDFDEEKFVSIVSAIEEKSSHALSFAITSYAKSRNVNKVEVESFDSFSGLGISGTVDGKEYKIGNEKFVGNCPELQKLSKEGKTAVAVSENNKIIGVVAMLDLPKDSSKKAIEKLKLLGVKTVMLTGDKKETAEALAKSVGIDEVIAGVLPEEKQSFILKIKEEGLTAFVGDGVNDALAIKSADIGIAMSSGSEITVDSGDIVLTNSDLMSVSEGVVISRRILKKIKQNLFWAFCYNVLCIPLAAGVLAPVGITLNPMIGSLCMSLSSIFVVTNSISIKKEEKIKKMKKEIVIDGMMCMHCSGRVEKTLNGISGVTAKVDLAKKTAYVEHDGTVSDETLRSAIENAGYTVVSIK